MASSFKTGSDSMLALGGGNWGWVTSFKKDDGSTVGVSSLVLASPEGYALARAETDALRDGSKGRSNSLLSSLQIGVGYLFRSWPSMRKQPCSGRINILGLTGHLSKLSPNCLGDYWEMSEVNHLEASGILNLWEVEFGNSPFPPTGGRDVPALIETCSISQKSWSSQSGLPCCQTTQREFPGQGHLHVHSAMHNQVLIQAIK